MIRIAVLVKQVPKSPDRPLTAAGTLDRATAAEMNPHCRRAVAKAVELAGADGELVVVTMGPPSASAVLMEALTYAERVTVDVRGVLITDARLVGADTLVTARVLAAALRRSGPFDLILTGRGTSDADTGQVSAQVAELLGLPLMSTVRSCDVVGGTVTARCEHDDGWYRTAVALPAVISCAERLCAPCKLAPEEIDDSTRARIATKSIDELGLADDALLSPTRVIAVERQVAVRRMRILDGADPVNIAAVVAALGAPVAVPSGPAPPNREAAEVSPSGQVTLVLAEPDRPVLLSELIGTARRMRPGATIVVAALGPLPGGVPASFRGADEILWIDGAVSAAAVAATLAAEAPPAVFLASATTWGREVAARYGARTGCGVIADAVAVTMRTPHVVGQKCSPDGTIADIVSDSPTQIVTLRAGGSQAIDAVEGALPAVERYIEATTGDLLRYDLGERDAEAHALGTASIVIGVGRGVDEADLDIVADLARALGAHIGASRAVTDAHLLPVSRQIGITGRSIAPAVYLALGIAGKATHMLGVRHAGTVIAINTDPGAPIFGACDLGIVGDWRDVAAALTTGARRREIVTAES